MPVAFSPAAGLGPENLGPIAHADGDFDVPAALKKGDGKIIVPDEDTALIARLDDYHGLKRTTAPRDPDPEMVVDRFEDMTVDQLKNEANTLGLDKPGRSRDELLASVRGAANKEA